MALGECFDLQQAMGPMWLSRSEKALIFQGREQTFLFNAKFAVILVYLCLIFNIFI